MSNQVPLGYVPISSSAQRPLGAAYIPILLSEVEQEQRGHGNMFERISLNFNFEWTKFEFSKNRNKFDSLCSNFEQTAVSIKRTSDISPIHLVLAAPWGRLCSHLAKRGRTGAKTWRERRSRSDRSGSWSL